MGRSRQRTGKSDAGDEPSALEQGRLAHARRAWGDAFTWLSRADALEPLGDEDLEKLAWAAGLSGQDDESLRLLERLYAHVPQAGRRRAAPCPRLPDRVGLTPRGTLGRCWAPASKPSA